MTPRVPRPGTITSLIAELDASDREAGELAGGLDAHELRRAPAPGVWSVGQCLEHLATTTEAFLPLLEEAVRALPPGGAPARPYRLGVTGALLVWLMEPPSWMKTKTAPRFAPGPGTAGDVLDRVRASQDRLRALARGADGRRLERARIVSPFNASAGYSRDAALRMLAAHQRRHLDQAARLIRSRPDA